MAHTVKAYISPIWKYGTPEFAESQEFLASDTGLFPHIWELARILADVEPADAFGCDYPLLLVPQGSRLATILAESLAAFVNAPVQA